MLVLMFKLKTEIDNLIANAKLSNDNTKIEIDDIDNDLPTLILNTYNRNETVTFSQIIITWNILIPNLI